MFCPYYQTMPSEKQVSVVFFVQKKNPVGTGLGPLAHVYGQLGYVYRFGKKYVDDDE